MEHKLLDFWKEIDAFKRVRAKNEGKPTWSFLDGPITANNPMGVHHAWGRSYKDMFQRYHAMNGKQLRYQNGFDCQGLWVEVEVEKAMGLGTKADIVEYGLEHFTRACKERVLTYAARQTAQSVRLGYWTDWDSPETLLTLRDALHEKKETVTITTPSGKEVTGSPEEIIGQLGSFEFGGSYFTFSTENNYTIWSFLKKCHEQNFIYRGTDVMPWCCRCGTGLSQMEVAEGRKITKHTSVFVRFPLHNRDKEALLVWTTTPWTLTSNVAAAVNPKMTYLKVRHGEWTYYIGKGNFESARVQNLEAAGQRETHTLHTLENILKGSGSYEVLGELPGADLVGLTYDGPFDHLPAQQEQGGVLPYPPVSGIHKTAVECHQVIAWDMVSEGEGTGIVHIAPGCGAEDSRLGKELDLVSIAPLREDGTYLEAFGALAGRHVSDVTPDIVQDLKERGVLLAKESYPHVYPHCWRCKEELVFRLVDEWFIRMDWRDRIQEVVPQIRWIPADGEAREQDWLKNMGDWMISKKRFWGLALPIWTCPDCDWFTVIGSKEELHSKATGGWDEFEGHTPHRPHVDKVTIQCESCGNTAHRVGDVGNPWLDAGIVPYSTMHYGTDPEHWEKWFPADFVVECFPGQFRNWFYSLLATSGMMTGKPPFKVLLGHALVRDARGEEMHKSAGNSIAFDEAADIMGAEIMRYLYAAQKPTQNLNFPDLPKDGAPRKGTIDGEIRKKILTWWNCYSFFITYANVDNWTVDEAKVIPVDQRGELDRWILSRLQSLVSTAHTAFADFSIYRFMERFEHFNDQFSNWYLRRSRRRFWKSEGDQDKESAYQTMHEVLYTLMKLMAPILPFLAEEMYQNLIRSVDKDAPDTIHMLDYPVVKEDYLDPQLEVQVDCVIRTKNLGLGMRNRGRIKVRQPLGELFVCAAKPTERDVLTDPHFCAQILEECNLKKLTVVDDRSSLAKMVVKPNFAVLGPKHGRYMKAIAAQLASAQPSEVANAVKGDGYTLTVSDGTEIVLGEEDVMITLEGPEHLLLAEDYDLFAALDTRISPELEAEGIARDFNRLAQDQRKALNLDVSDRIQVCFTASDRIASALATHKDSLAVELLADSIVRKTEGDGFTPGKAGGEKITLSVSRSSQ